MRWAILAILLSGCGSGEQSGAADAQQVDASATDASPLDAALPDASAPDAEPRPPFDPACIGTALGSALWGEAAIPTTPVTAGVAYVRCPMPDFGAAPPVCALETNLATATLSETSSSTGATLTGTIPYRVQKLDSDVTPFGGCTGSLTLAMNSNGACPGGTFAHVPVQIQIAIDPAQDNSLAVTQVISDTTAATSAIATNTSLCGPPCTDPCTCGVSGVDHTAYINQTVADLVPLLEVALVADLERALCLTGRGCPAGATPDAGGICRYGDGSCPPSDTVIYCVPPGGP